MRLLPLISVFLYVSLWIGCRPSGSYVLETSGKGYTISTQNYILDIEKQGFTYTFTRPDGTLIAPAHEVSGLEIVKVGEAPSTIVSTHLISNTETQITFEIETASSLRCRVDMYPSPHSLKMEAKPTEAGRYTIVARTGGMGPAYGMADHAAVGEGGQDLVLENFIRDPLISDRGGQRMISNFVIFPQQGFAEVNIEPREKLVRITDSENAQGSRQVAELPAMYYFIGTPKEIYQAFLTARMEEGYLVSMPKHEWFGVGWEAFGALAWRTNHETVKQNIDRYLELGYPLSWMVVGSGFWPRGVGEFDAHGTPYGSESESEDSKKLQATTSFGMWDKQLYPDPRGFIDYFHKKGLIFTIGLRIGFIPGGPFTEEGLENKYFIQDDQGKAQLFQIGFPRVPIHLLDSKNQEAVDWYVELCQKWLDYGVDGFKEDLFSWPKDLQDDLIDPVNRKLMEQGVYIMGRCNYLGSPADIHRYNDFNYNQSQDRGPINGLAYAFSGFPNVYPDISGGTGLATGRFGKESRGKLSRYLIRYSQYASLNPSMSFGFGPWNFDEKTNRLCLEAATLHHRLKPYIFSNAVKAYNTGFPYPMTPLPLAYPQDESCYGLADTSQRSYQWLIGESLLAAPLFGDDYATAFSRDIYLPKGKWMDYETGEIYEGGQMLENFEIPIEKIPLFVGGNGFVVEQEGNALLGRLYPIKKQSEFVFWYADAQTKTEINIHVEDWENLAVMDAETGSQVNISKVRHAWQFVLQPGHNYQIR